MSQKKSDYMYFFHGIRNNYKIFSDTFNHYMILKKLLEILAWTMGKKIIVPSIKAEALLINNYRLLLRKKSFVILPNLVRKEFAIKYSSSDINQFQAKFGIQNKKIILYSGRLVSGKGIENLVAAFLQITDKYPEMILVIAYSGNPNIKLRNKERKIKYLSDLKITDLVKLNQSSYLAVLPSPFEISSLFLREALTCNLPIITTDAGDSYKVLSDLFILKDNKINTIYSKIIDYIKNNQRYDQGAKTMFRSWKKQYNKDKIINTFLEALKI
jgi:glycosyltransferase involved in cell wall biosynthesis